MRDSESDVSPVAKRPRVIVVDDDEAVRTALGMLIKAFGWESQIFASAHEFLHKYEQADGDCLVLDLQMPDITGTDLLESLAAHGITVPVIIITAFLENELSSRALRAGARTILKKPFRDEVLLQEIRDALDIALH